MVWTIQLQQTEKLRKVRTTGSAGVRSDRHHGASWSISRAKRLAVVDGGKILILIFENALHSCRLSHANYFVVYTIIFKVILNII